MVIHLRKDIKLCASWLIKKKSCVLVIPSNHGNRTVYLGLSFYVIKAETFLVFGIETN